MATIRQAGWAVLGVLLAAGLTPLAAADDPPAAAKKFVGRWEGTMRQPGFDPFPVAVEIDGFGVGKWCGVLEHDKPIDAEGDLLGVSAKGDTMTLAASITRGRARCQDGLTVLTWIDKDTVERVWIDPATGKPGAKGVLKRVSR